jgi:HSP20 family protein
MSDKDLQLQEKQELQTGAENTRNAPVFIPPVDIFESEHQLTLLADMPGVGMDKVEIDLNNDQLTIKGSVHVEDGNGTVLLREYGVGDYYRQFTLSNTIDRARIEATIKDGVLKVVLPKVEPAKPRRIEVKSS